jgi:TolB-like protein/DNA-binding winged helix-turn-helix (wHTH) protein/Tfp pilus assembly protein PilF
MHCLGAGVKSVPSPAGVLMASEPIKVKERISFGDDFELEVSARRLRRGTDVLKLERIPLEILVLLLEHAGEIVTRDEIVAKVWGKGAFLDTDNGIRGAIRKIRQVLKDDPEYPRFIETVTGLGYRFIARLRLEEEETERRAESPVRAGADSGSGGTFRAHRWLVLGGLAVLALVAVAYVTIRSRAGIKPKIRSLAVLPLSNLSGDPAQDYLADGMTEALITDLAKVGALRVISRTSVMQYKTGMKPLPQIGRELNVDAVVEGSVQRSGDHLRVTAQLLQANPERHLWAESYERDLRDVLALQSELARTIASEIRVKVTPQEEARLANVQPVNPSSYEAYLKGLFYFNDGRDHIGSKRGDESFQKSADYLRQAVQIDPNYAMAYAQLARTYHWRASQVYTMEADGRLTMPGELPAESKVAARKALELNPTLADAHGALAFVMFAFDWDWVGAEQEFKRATELNPGYGEPHHGYALYLLTMGRLDEAIVEINKALLLDPLTLPQKTNAAYIYACAGQYDRSIEQLRTVLALNPEYFEARFALGRMYIRKGMVAQGIREIQDGAKLPGGDVYSRRELALAYAASGRKDEASRLLNHLTEKSKAPVDIATIYALLGDKPSAIAWLEKAAQQGPLRFSPSRCIESLDSVRVDPHVREMFTRLGLPQ